MQHHDLGAAADASLEQVDSANVPGESLLR
jgi:hypothetical protein